MTLRATNLSIEFGCTSVLKDVSFGVEPGEIVTIIGPSGTGKTTLLRLLGLFREPNTGTVSWDETDLWELSAEDRFAFRRRMSIVFQEPSLFNVPVRQNVTYGIRVRQPWRERVRQKFRTLRGNGELPDSVHNALDLVGLRDRLDQNANSLSGGEAQRVAFARALAIEPEIMLLDEPTSNLDPQNTAVLETAIQRARERGVGIVVATHDMHQAKRLSDRVGFLFDGKLVETGPVKKIFEDPDDVRTERFINGELLYAKEQEKTKKPVSPAAGGF